MKPPFTELDTAEVATILEALEAHLDALIDTRQQDEIVVEQERAELDAEIDRTSALITMAQAETNRR